MTAADPTASERAFDEALAAEADARASATAARVAQETTAHVQAAEAASPVPAPAWGWASPGVVVALGRIESIATTVTVK